MASMTALAASRTAGSISRDAAAFSARVVRAVPRFASSMPFYEEPAGMLHWPDSTKEATPNDPLCYTSSGLLVDQGALFERVMYVGGPGGDSPGCN